MTQDKSAEYLKIANSDLCLEEKLARHFAIHFGHDVPFFFVELAFGLIWAHDINSPKLDVELPMKLENEPSKTFTMRGQIEEFQLAPYLGKSLVPVRPEHRAHEWILACDASLDQKLKWHLKHFDRAVPMQVVPLCKQAIWLDSYGFDWDATMVPLPERILFEGAREASLRNIIEGHRLEFFLTPTDDNGRAPASLVSARGGAGGDTLARGDAGQDVGIWDNQ